MTDIIMTIISMSATFLALRCVDVLFMIGD